MSRRVRKTITLPYKFDPRLYQDRMMDWYDQGGRNGIYVWHRRAGKDLTGLHQTCKMAHQRKGMYWHCLPTFSQARKAVWNAYDNSKGERLLRSIFPKEIVKHPDEFRPQAEMLIELRNGSMIQLIGSDNIDNIVGAGPLHVTFSEYALCKPNSYDLVRPMLRENAGTTCFISTPRGRNHLWQLMQKNKGNKAWMIDTQTVFDTNLRYPSAVDPKVLITPAEMMEEERQAGMLEPLIKQEYLCDFDAALVGSIFGDLMEQLEKEGRICDFAHDGSNVFTVYDLGMNDSTAIWIFEAHEGGIDIIDHYENHGKALQHYFDHVEQVAAELHLTFRKHWLPHDAKALTLAAGTTIENQFRERYGDGAVAVIPSVKVLEGIQAFRWVLQQNTRIHSRCNKHQGIEALKQYHFEFDDKSKAYTNRPEHDWASHTADAARYLGYVARVSGILTRPRPPKPRVVVFDTPQGEVKIIDPPIIRPTSQYHLEELFAARDQDMQAHRRIT